jgi:hypothetical protein
MWTGVMERMFQHNHTVRTSIVNPYHLNVDVDYLFLCLRLLGRLGYIEKSYPYLGSIKTA